MILKKAVISNFRSISGTVEVDFNHFNCIVGQNDAGKSTILKALEAFLNEPSLDKAEHNVNATEDSISVELHFDPQNFSFSLGEQIDTTFEAEEIVNENGLLVIKKVWNVTASVGKPKMSIVRKQYEGGNDFLLKTEKQLISQCKEKEIPTTKGNGEEFNNVEKRQKLRAHNDSTHVAFEYAYEDMPTSGTSKAKMIADAIKQALPAFQYFKADTSLSDTDAAIQKYFKKMAFDLIKTEIDTDEIETQVRDQLQEALAKITSKINEVVKSTDTVRANVDFDWNKLISTSFVSDNTGTDLPLSSRGDGFRRITMMSYFEYLAETERKDENQQIIFGFEEPETFLHPSAQEDLFEKLVGLTENGYQVVLSTHSSTIVGNSQKEHLIHISRPDNVYSIEQTEVNYKAIAQDLGIKPDNTFTPLFSTARGLLLVEGVSDVIALNHNSLAYKEADAVSNTFEELGILIVPLGSCGAVKHWVNLELFTKLEKPFHIFLDSDKEELAAQSLNERLMSKYGLEPGQHYTLTKKRLLENYIHPDALKRLVPGLEIQYGDFDHAKNCCGKHPNNEMRTALGGYDVAEKHYRSLTFDELRMSWFDGEEDEFINLFNTIKAKLN